MSVLRYAVLTLGLLAIAWPITRPDAAGPMTGAEWRVVELGGKPVTGAGTLRFVDGKASGKAACNYYAAAVKENSGLVRIAITQVTVMNCQGRMGLERHYLNALADVRGYRREGARLLLTGSSGQVLMTLES